MRERGREPENSVHCQSQDGAERLKGSRPEIATATVHTDSTSHYIHCTFDELLEKSEVVLLGGAPPDPWLSTAKELTK